MRMEEGEDTMLATGERVDEREGASEKAASPCTLCVLLNQYGGAGGEQGRPPKCIKSQFLSYVTFHGSSN